MAPWQGSEEPADKHAAAARHEFKFDDAVLELDFKFDGAKTVSLSINDAKNHLCRVQVLPDRFRVMKDDHDGPKGPDKGQVLAEKQIELKPGAWHRIRVEFKGPQMTAGSTTLLLAASMPRSPCPRPILAWWSAARRRRSAICASRCRPNSVRFSANGL